MTGSEEKRGAELRRRDDHSQSCSSTPFVHVLVCQSIGLRNGGINACVCVFLPSSSPRHPLLFYPCPSLLSSPLLSFLPASPSLIPTLLSAHLSPCPLFLLSSPLLSYSLPCSSPSCLPLLLSFLPFFTLLLSAHLSYSLCERFLPSLPHILTSPFLPSHPLFFHSLPCSSPLLLSASISFSPPWLTSPHFCLSCPCVGCKKSHS